MKLPSVGGLTAYQYIGGIRAFIGASTQYKDSSTLFDTKEGLSKKGKFLQNVKVKTLIHQRF